ncbi:MAG: hypothetical protein KME04_03215 [Pleurocapsa minor GSE-CHR-MK-17-07R]|nr:hypothetical protein [Pleurocapsa minor GSE-CHR-MK 17-07R]
MPRFTVFSWREGAGTLVLSGAPGDDVRATVLMRNVADGAVACVFIGSDPGAADAMLDDLEDLGAPSGYLVDVLSEDDDLVRDRIGEASIIVINSYLGPNEVRSAMTGAAYAGLEAAYANGAIILAEGSACAMFGDAVVDGEVRDGFAWLEGALIAAGGTLDDLREYGAQVLIEYPEKFMLLLGSGGALAFSADGRVETWGDGEVTIQLGAKFSQAFGET